MCILRYVEARVSCPTLESAIQAMRNMDVEQLFNQSPSGAVLPSWLPIHALGDRAAVSGFLFYESSLPVLAVTGCEVELMRQRAREPTPFLDTLLRFRRYITLERIQNSECVGRSWNRFCEAVSRADPVSTSFMQILPAASSPDHAALASLSAVRARDAAVQAQRQTEIRRQRNAIVSKAFM